MKQCYHVLLAVKDCYGLCGDIHIRLGGVLGESTITVDKICSPGPLALVGHLWIIKPYHTV